MARTLRTATKSTASEGLGSSTADLYVESELSEVEFSDDASASDSDYENGRQKGKAPPAKKAKKNPTKQPAAKGSKQKKSLSLLPAMPLDVLFEVFSHLTPKDIIHLSRTSRILRDTLMTRSATCVWKAAREQFRAPECPLNMSEPQWCDLLFGNLCQSCGAKNIPKPDFALLRRICTACKKANLVVESKFRTRFPDVDPQILVLLPYTNVGGWSHGHARGSRFFWASDISTMMRKMSEYQHNIHLHRPNAQKTLDDFKTRQLEIVLSNLSLKFDREKWCDEFATGRYRDKHSLMVQRFESIKAKFIELGYVASDVSYISSKRECQQAAPLTDRIWNRIRPILEPTVLQHKRERLDREMRDIRSARKAIICTSYQEYQKTLKPSQWNYLPNDISALNPFAEVVDANVDVSVTAADFEEAFRQLPELLSASFDVRRLQARSLLKIPTSTSSEPASRAQEPGDILEGEAALPTSQSDVLDLATATFTCQESYIGYGCRVSYLFGWDDIAQHHCMDPFNTNSFGSQYFATRTSDPPKFAFSPLGSAITAAVVRAAGLDDRIATGSDMDAKDLRFGCSTCLPSKKNGAWTRTGYKWRDVVSHCTNNSHTLLVLSSDDITKVKESEMNDPNRSRKVWTCGHCTVHLGDLKLRETVVEHVKSAHGIDLPREPEDLFLFARNQYRDTFEASYPVDPPSSTTPNNILKNIRCLQCASGKLAEQRRLFDLGGVRNHLVAKHKVTSPLAGVDYR